MCRGLSRSANHTPFPDGITASHLHWRPESHLVLCAEGIAPKSAVSLDWQGSKEEELKHKSLIILSFQVFCFQMAHCVHRHKSFQLLSMGQSLFKTNQKLQQTFWLQGLNLIFADRDFELVLWVWIVPDHPTDRLAALKRELGNSCKWPLRPASGLKWYFQCERFPQRMIQSKRSQVKCR